MVASDFYYLECRNLPVNTINMTWEEKFNILVGNQDKLNGQLDIRKENCLTDTKNVETAIAEGDIDSIQLLIPKLAIGLAVCKEIFPHMELGKKLGLVGNPVNCNYHFYVSNGKWSYGFYAWGEDGLTPKYLLKLSRLIRDAEKRCLKHPRYCKL